MKKLLSIICLASLIFTINQAANAKRPAPENVSPVIQADVEYRVPVSTATDLGKGIIEAWDKKTNTLLWWRQIYVITYQPGLERDIQDVYIKNITFSAKNQSKKEIKATAQSQGFLIIETERNDKYQLNLKTLQVMPLNGAKMVLRRKNNTL